ncbi:MAG: glycerol acyltransferase [Desulfobacteraceae bacterium IS3]|nr:MAG: glycerol acyltransferase [Desulfobacteraceae bacterium IS3]
MNRFAYLTSGFAVKTLSRLSKARINIHGKENLPDGTSIFVINHFTRIETLLMPYYICQLTGVPVWSLADYGLFKGSLGVYLDKVGAVSTRNPDRDRIIVKSLLTGEANWIIFPEGFMVKTKKIFEKGQFMVSSPEGTHPPHTGAATLALRAEFYRRRLLSVRENSPDEAKRVSELFGMDSVKSVSEKPIYIVPVNITYYPIRARENILNKLAANLVEDMPDRAAEEIMIEGTMLLSGVDIDIRFGKPIPVGEFICNTPIEKDIAATCEINFDDPIPSKQVMRNVSLKMMQQYMSAIYSMTTVNHDHLFASVLKQIPFQKIDEADLRRRVFLAASLNLGKNEIFHHTSLDADQVHLLTDDRYNKYKEFIAIATEKGVIRKEDNTLVKDSSKFSVPSDFHRMRIENPVSVIANEVEPLAMLQRHIRGIAWQPAFRIRRRVFNYLQNKELAEFENDYKAYYIKGESKGKEVGSPFLLKGASKDMGVVLIHGYMAAPLEVRELAEYLARRGLWVYCPRLKGHGTAPDDLAVRSYKDWIESVDTGFALISSITKHVVAGGFSTGAALALDLAARASEVRGVFAVCPPLRLQDFAARFAPAVDTWNRLMTKVHLGVKKEFVENRPENPHINYVRNPISGIKEIGELMDSLEPRLSEITIPAMIIQTLNDPVVNYKGSRQIFKMLGSEDKQYILFNFDRHGILMGKGSHKVHEAIWNFIKYL